MLFLEQGEDSDINAINVDAHSISKRHAINKEIALNHQGKVMESFQSKNRIEGLTHNFYRYPARFAPEFAREIILEFSKEGDVILDAFMGGGTTIIEAIANDRFAYGIDINPLAYFITRVKTTPLSYLDKELVLAWAESIELDNSERNSNSVTDMRLRNVPEVVKEFFSLAVFALESLKFPRQRYFARCALMRIGQWAIECCKDLPSLEKMKSHLVRDVLEMIKGLDSLTAAAKSHGIKKNKISGRRSLYMGSVDDVISRGFNKFMIKPRLILTSPPYPGVHVLYHRWQINGRKETPAPYWLADQQDGHGESYYTLGGRSKKGQQEYFINLSRTYNSLRQLVDDEGIVVQLVAFSDPETQLPAFLQCMTSAGYQEITPFCSSNSKRPYREVPHRKWYTQFSQNNHASNEVLLIHRPIH